jgi:hypothetical protein
MNFLEDVSKVFVERIHSPWNQFRANRAKPIEMG